MQVSVVLASVVTNQGRSQGRGVLGPCPPFNDQRGPTCLAPPPFVRLYYGFFLFLPKRPTFNKKRSKETKNGRQKVQERNQKRSKETKKVDKRSKTKKVKFLEKAETTTKNVTGLDMLAPLLVAACGCPWWSLYFLKISRFSNKNGGITAEK